MLCRSHLLAGVACMCPHGMPHSLKNVAGVKWALRSQGVFSGRRGAPPSITQSAWEIQQYMTGTPFISCCINWVAGHQWLCRYLLGHRGSRIHVHSHHLSLTGSANLMPGRKTRHPGPAPSIRISPLLLSIDPLVYLSTTSLISTLHYVHSHIFTEAP